MDRWSSTFARCRDRLGGVLLFGNLWAAITSLVATALCEANGYTPNIIKQHRKQLAPAQFSKSGIYNRTSYDIAMV